MKIRRSFLAIGVLSAPSLIPWAQTQLPAPEAPPMADDDLSSLVLGEFTGDLHADAIVLANGKPVMRQTVEVYETYLEANLQAVDLARLAGTGSDGRDQAVAIGPGGLFLLEVGDPSGWVILNLRGAGSQWANAVAVATGQVDGLHGDDIVAVTPNRVLLARSNGAGGWMSDVTLLAGTTIDGVELVDWDGKLGGALEIAALIGSGPMGAARVRVLTAGGAALATIQSTGADRIVAAPVATAAGGRRWLALVSTTFATGAQDLGVVSETTVSGPWSLGAAGVHDLAAGDWNGDGIEDLVLGTNTDRDTWLHRLEVAGNALTLSAATPVGTPIQLPVGHPQRTVSVQDGGLALGDVDLDQDLDLVVAVQGNYLNTDWTYLDRRFSCVVVTPNGTENQYAWMPWHAPGTSWPEGIPEPSLLANGDIAVPLVTPTELLSGAVFEVVVWHTPTMDSLMDPTPMVAPSYLGICLLEVEGVGSYSMITIPAGQQSAYFTDRYSVVVRQVKLGPGGVVEEARPALAVTLYSAQHASEYSAGWNVLSVDTLHVPMGGDPGGVSATQGLGSLPPGVSP